MGQDLEALVGWGLAMLAAAQEERDPQKNPAVALGLLMAAGVDAKKDKLTLLLPNRLEPFGLWVEQLVAESTGKQGTGVVPIAGEPVPRHATDYGDDRVFVYTRLGDGGSAAVPAGHSDVELTAAGFSCAAIEWSAPESVGAEFVRWEVATAVAGALLRINPFDEPNVQQAKDATRSLLDSYKTTGELPRRPAVRTPAPGVGVTMTRAARERAGDADEQALSKLVSSRDYVAILAFLGPSQDLARELSEFRRNVLARTRAATMFGYGPRYLHSTGQLHKGGPDTGVFVLITATAAADLPIPGEPYSFGTLELAQGLGDFESLDASGRRALHVHLSQPEPRLLRLALSSLLG
jgi:glucose-6-phosphate isomerase/transaldolase/glucose-6-phosphate isomerase